MTKKPRVRRSVRDSTPMLLLLAAHPRLGVVTAAALTGAAALAGRPPREVGLVLATALVGQAVLGWHNDLVDRTSDAAHERTGKPVADGRLDAGSVWFTLCCAVLLLIPLCVSNGVVAGGCYAASVLIGCLGNVGGAVLRRGALSFLPWAVSFALLPPFLSYGGWGGRDAGSPPEPAVVIVAALLGVGVHLFVSAWGLVRDAEDGWTYPPLRLGRRVGASRLIVIGVTWIAVAIVGLLLLGASVGLSR